MGSNSVVAAWTQQAVIRSGFTPDVIVDNLPAATHRGEDAQLTAAITTLQALLRGRSLLAGDSPLPSPPVRYFVAAAGSERRRARDPPQATAPVGALSAHKKGNHAHPLARAARRHERTPRGSRKPLRRSGQTPAPRPLPSSGAGSTVTRTLAGDGNAAQGGTES